MIQRQPTGREDLVQSQGKRGRPRTFSRDDREYLAELIRQYGIRGARRRTAGFVSQNTLIKIARDFEIQLSKGRRPRSAAGKY